MNRARAGLAAVVLAAAGCGPGAEASKPNPDLPIPKSTDDPKTAKISRGGVTAENPKK